MSEVKIDREHAQDDIERWADARRMSDKKKAANSETIESLVDAIEQGVLIVNEDFSLTQKFTFPIENTEGAIELGEIKFTPRLRYKSVKQYMKSIKQDDAMGMVHAHICALTSTPMGLIDSLDMTDLGLSRQIASLFF